MMLSSSKSKLLVQHILKMLSVRNINTEKRCFTGIVSAFVHQNATPAVVRYNVNAHLREILPWCTNADVL